MPHPRGLYSRTNAQGEVRWYVRISVDGTYQRFAPHGGFLTQKEAAAFLQHARADLTRGKFFPEQFQRHQPCTLADLLTEQSARLADFATSKNDRHYQRWWIHHHGTVDVRQITPALIEAAKMRLTTAGLSAQTIYHYLKFLRHRLNLAVRDDMLERNPFAKIALGPVHNMRIRFYPLHERRALYHAIGPVWREAAELAGITGLRWSEQFKRPKAHIHLQERFVELPTTKAGRPQVRILSKRAVQLLRRQIARHPDSPWLYPNVDGTKPIHYSVFWTRIWAPACRAADVTDARWNDWRHTFASDLTMRGHSDRTVADLLGHSSTKLVKRYAHLAVSHLRKAVDSIANT